MRPANSADKAARANGNVIPFPRRRRHPHLHDVLMFCLGALAMLFFIHAI